VRAAFRKTDEYVESLAVAMVPPKVPGISAGR